MNYELAKQLKDAGYNLSTIYSYDEFVIENDRDVKGELIRYRVPTLSELIEACGDRFDKLERDEMNKEWEATGDEYFNGIGKTPEEAVAKLWLELNK